ncbi:glycerate kinase [uncultured Amnibacterium sp.]|uniref:glycerate kinase n=1 Tax=uncultured Amnibacterium sp. TaxID=1631851 RepID=UPI0035CC2BD7
MNNPSRTVVIAPDSFKGSATAVAVGAALAAGWSTERTGDRVVVLPMADGGEGTLDALEAAVPGGQRQPVLATGPDGRVRATTWLLLPATPGLPGGTGVVEVAETSGLPLLGGRLLPMTATTTGLGETIRGALTAGVSRLVVGLGGSASTDGAAGALAALGALLLDGAGAPIGAGAAGLAQLARIERAGLVPIPVGGVDLLTDVDAPLTGPTGAAAVFAPQKGATAPEVSWMDAALAAYAAILGADPDVPGSGAAGGSAYGLAWWGGRVVPGSAAVAALVGLPAAIAAADVVITGEGRWDGQSTTGKAPAHVATLAAAARVPVLLVAGRIDAPTTGFAAAVALTDQAPAESTIADPLPYLRAAGAALARAWA